MKKIPIKDTQSSPKDNDDKIEKMLDIRVGTCYFLTRRYETLW
ncbi:9615_t:CDS:2 [Entrophospora sp. SA101]|nr:9615_t:CDS:2 [Entrophospora sp. SA101]